MKQTNASPKVAVACLLLVGAAVGTWAISHERAGASPKDAHSAAMNAAPEKANEKADAKQNALPSLPTPSGNTLSDQMIGKWTALVQKNAKDDMAWTNLGDSYMQKARETADVTYYGHAEKAYQRALDLNPTNVPALNGMAWVNGGRHEFEKSIAWANKAIAISPKDNDAYGLIGDADVEMGNYDAAYTHYQQMLDIHPDTSSYSRGAHLLWLMGDERKGMWLMAKAIKAGGPYAENTAWCRTQLATMLTATGALLPAEQTLEDALKHSPHNYQVLAAMGRLKAAKRDYPAAINYYKQAIEVVPMHDSLVALGDLYQLTGQPEEAKKQFALVEATHQLLKANGVRGDMQIAQFYADHDRNLPEAVAEEELEVKTRPNVYVEDTLAWAYYKVGRYQDAQDMIEKALARHTPEAAFKFHAGMIEAKLNNIVSAKKHLYESLSQNPNFSLIYAPIAADTLKQLGSRPLDNGQVPPTSAGGQSAGAAAR